MLVDWDWKGGRKGGWVWLGLDWERWVLGVLVGDVAVVEVMV